MGPWFGPFAQKNGSSGGFRVGGQGTSGFGNLELAEAGLKQYLIFTDPEKQVLADPRGTKREKSHVSQVPWQCGQGK